jgi:hypothetical protein
MPNMSVMNQAAEMRARHEFNEKHVRIFVAPDTDCDMKNRVLVSLYVPKDKIDDNAAVREILRQTLQEAINDFDKVKWTFDKTVTVKVKV